MLTPPERSAERDAAIVALLPNVVFDGWTMPALRAAAGPDADLLFPGGSTDMIEAYCDLGDRWMEQGAIAADVASLRLSQRVRAIVALRLEQNRPYKDAVRRALAVLALPGNAGLALRCTARTVDTIWFAAGDGSADFSWYSKRAILAGVYGATLLYWLGDGSDDDGPTLAFLDRRLRGVGRIGGIRRRMDAVMQRFRPNAAA
jgi:ubiquinone biosynthesis protein COQ9